MIAVRLIILIHSLKLVMGKREAFIVGGEYVESIRLFPHVAFLTLQRPSNQTLACGSSILNQMILITAAHCLDDIVAITASVGDVQRDHGKLYRVLFYKQHKKWNTVSVERGYDIGLCRLAKPLMLGQTVKRVMLMKDPPNVQSADVAGWGATEEKYFTRTIYLKHTKQKLWTRNQCKKIINSLPEGTICGGRNQAKEDYVSKGDSGSGLLVDKKIIVGVVSYKDFDISSSVVVYTDVTYFYDWIVSSSRQLRCLV